MFCQWLAKLIHWQTGRRNTLDFAVASTSCPTSRVANNFRIVIYSVSGRPETGGSVHVLIYSRKEKNSSTCGIEHTKCLTLRKYHIGKNVFTDYTEA
jgi:hypothetical protein